MVEPAKRGIEKVLADVVPDALRAIERQNMRDEDEIAIKQEVR